MDVINVVAPIFGLILAGWLLKRIGLLSKWLVDKINDYVYYIGISVVTFVSLHDTSTSLLLDPTIYILTIVPIIAIFCIAYAAARMMKLKRDTLAIFVVCAFFGNTAYIGFPLNIMVQGKESLNITAFVSTIYVLMVFTLGVFLLKKYADGPVEAGKLHKLPVLWAAILGVLLSWLAIPGVLRFPMELISDTTSPLALLATGAMVEVGSLKSDLKPIGVLSGLKLALMPMIVVLLAIVINGRSDVYKTVLLEAATPVGVTNSVLAAQFKMRHDFASQAVVITTALFAVSLTILLLFI